MGNSVELSDLTVFRSVVEAGGITRAAAKLHRVPSNITTRVRQLETSLGVQLFYREKRQMSLTPQGEVLLDYADRILALARQAKEAMHNAKPIGRLRLGAMESTAATRLPAPLSDYHRKYPEVVLELRIAPTRDLVNLVIAGELDAALVADRISDSRLRSTVVYEEELVLISDKQRKRVRTPADIANGSALTFAPGCSYRERLEGWFAQSGVVPKQVIELASYNAILGCAMTGMGVALVPRSIIALYPSRSALGIHSMPSSVSRSKTYLIWRENVRAAKLDALAEVLKLHAPKLAAERDR